VNADALAAADPLAQLRDIHLPPDPGWWPPAPGWWMLAALLVAAVAWAIIALRRRHHALAPSRAALRELDAIEARLRAGEPPGKLLASLSSLLRRFALTRFPATEVAGRTGRHWLEFLDRHGGDGDFEQGPGACLAEAPYAPEPDVDPGPVIVLARRWITAQRGTRGQC
jgi:hypothetical protein